MIIWKTPKNDELKITSFFFVYNASREISFGTETYVDVAAAQIKEHCRSMGLNKRNAVHLYFIGCPF